MIGKLLASRYRLISGLGEGASGVVFRADDLQRRSSVALRILRPELAASPAIEAALRGRIAQREAIEVAAPGALEGLVDVIDIGRSDEHLFVVTPYIAGESLEVLLRRSGRLPWSRVQALALGLCQRLDACHRAGVVHGSLQLRHCFVSQGTSRGGIEIVATGIEPLLVELGGPLADAIAPALAAYAAPEQVSGDACDHRVDLYALGVCLYELLCGERPFTEANPKRLGAMHMLTPPPPLGERLRGGTIPAPVEAAIMRLLSKSPDDRFASAADVAEVLGAVDASPRPLPSLVIPRLVPHAPPPVAVTRGASPMPAAAADEVAGEIEASEATDPAQASDASTDAAQTSTGDVAAAEVAASETAAEVPASADEVTSTEAAQTSAGEVRAGADEAPASDTAPSAETPAAAREVAAEAGAPSPSASGSRRRVVSGPHASASGSMRARVIDLHPSASGSMRGRFDDIHPSSSGSMRMSGGASASASTSGSRRVVTLVEIRAAGESTSEGRIAGESTSGGLRPHAGENTMQRAVKAALAGAGVEDDDLISSSGRDTLASTIEAPTSDDDTISASGITPGPSRRAISWALGGIGAIVASSLAVALLSPASRVEPDEGVREAARPRAAAVAPRVAPTPREHVAPSMSPAPEAPAAAPADEATAKEPEAEVAAAAIAAAEEAAAKTPRKAGKAAAKASSGAKAPRAAKAPRSAKSAAAEEPEEDDVLTQVQEYMRKKKEAEAKRAGASAPAPAEPAPQDVASALDLLEQARKAYRRGENDAAYTLASQSQGLRRSADALEIMGLASCARGDSERARWVYRQIASSRRAAIQDRCRAGGITLD
ncbi:MAG: protein kinase [Myxococcales bacterium]|nr:protein kinase [Myxococcales bacterium]